MKTFETEKHNIPEGATHYCNATVAIMFCWFKFKSGNWYVMTEKDSIWHTCYNNKWKIYGAKPIPEEKEPLDAIEQVEWKNGDECAFDSREGVFIGLMVDKNLAVVEIKNPDLVCDIDYVELSSLSKPESPEAKKEREELENGEALYNLVQKLWSDVDDGYEPHPYDSPLVDIKVKSMYKNLAKIVGYRKGE